MARQQAMQYAHYAHAAIKRHIIKIYINEGSMLRTSFITCPLSNIEIIQRLFSLTLSLSTNNLKCLNFFPNRSKSNSNDSNF